MFKQEDPYCLKKIKEFIMKVMLSGPTEISLFQLFCIHLCTQSKAAFDSNISSDRNTQRFDESLLSKRSKTRNVDCGKVTNRTLIF